ncbi:MAG: DUF6152 family protein [Burkholderiaceae bacterium]
MHRRPFILTSLALPAVGLSGTAQAHHGWSSFDQDRPIYLEGKVVKATWQNPHTELDIEISSGLKIPTDLPRRSLPAQTAPVDGKALLAKAVLPKRKDTKWEIELAPLTRMQAWNVPEIKPGAQVAVLGFTFTEEKGDAVLRVEYLWLDGKTYALRSSPA